MSDDVPSAVEPEPISPPPDVSVPSADPVMAPPASPPDSPAAAVSSAAVPSPTLGDDSEVAWVLPAKIPGPGLLGAVGWVFLFLALRILYMIPWVAVVGLQGLHHYVNTVAISFVVVNFVLEIGLAALVLRQQIFRVLAVRSIHPLHVVLTLLLLLPMVTVSSAIHEGLRGWPDPHSAQGRSQAYQELAALPVGVILVIGCLLPAVGEEAFFRGFLTRGLVARHGLVLGVAVNSILFGLMHLDSLAHVASTAFIGAVVSLAFVRTKTLWAPVLLHALNNGLAFGAERLWAYFGYAGDESTDPSAGYPAPLVWTALAALVALLVLLDQTRTYWILPNGRRWAPGYLATGMPPRIVAARPVLTRPRPWAVAAALVTCGGFGWVLVSLFG